jgi:hypothetical protein
MGSHLSEIDLLEYAEGELSGLRRQRAQEHLQSCASCSEALQAAQEAMRAVGAMRLATPPRDLRARIVAKLEAQPLPHLTCREAAGLIHASLDTPLSLAQAGFLHLHLEGCAACRLEEATLVASTQAVRGLSPVPAPSGLRQAVRDAMPRSRPAIEAWTLRLRPAMAASAAVAAGTLLFLLRPGPQMAVVQQPAKPHSHMVAMAPKTVEKAVIPAPVQPDTQSSQVDPATVTLPEVAPVTVRVKPTLARNATTLVTRHRNETGGVRVAMNASLSAPVLPTPRVGPTNPTAELTVQPATARESDSYAIRRLRALASAKALQPEAPQSLQASAESQDVMLAEFQAETAPSTLPASGAAPTSSKPLGPRASGEGSAQI